MPSGAPDVGAGAEAVVSEGWFWVLAALVKKLRSRALPGVMVERSSLHPSARAGGATGAPPANSDELGSGSGHGGAAGATKAEGGGGTCVRESRADAEEAEGADAVVDTGTGAYVRARVWVCACPCPCPPL